MEGEKNQYQGVSGGQDEEVKSRGLFDFMKKNEEKTEKEEQKEEELIVSSMENVHVTQLEKMDMDKKDQEKKEKKEGLFARLHRSDSSSSSSSDEEEVGPDGEKKKKKKGLKEKIQEKIGGEKKEEYKPSEEVHVVAEQAHVTPPTPPPAYSDDTSIKVEKVDETVKLEEVSPHGEEKKGFLEKIKDKLPGQKKPTEEVHVTPPVPIGSEEVNSSDDKEKKGIFGKIMEKIKGPEQKDGEKTGESH